MTIKNLAIATIFTLAATSAMAESNWLHVRTSSGWQVFSLDQVDRLTFTGGQMTASDASGAVVASIPQNSIESMTVNESAGIQSVTVENQTATFKVNANGSVITAISDGKFEIYNTAGLLVETIPSVKAGETIDLSKLPAGIIIVKLGTYSQKVVLK